jgi:hypothetical protein
VSCRFCARSAAIVFIPQVSVLLVIEPPAAFYRSSPPDIGSLEIPLQGARWRD